MTASKHKSVSVMCIVLQYRQGDPSQDLKVCLEERRKIFTGKACMLQGNQRDVPPSHARPS